MIDLLLTLGDLDLSTGDIGLVSGTAECAQAYTIKIRTRQGEIPFDLNAGLDYERLFSAQSSMEYKQLVLRKALYDVSGVKIINDFQLLLDKATMTLFVTANVTTNYSSTEIITVQL